MSSILTVSSAPTVSQPPVEQASPLISNDICVSAQPANVPLAESKPITASENPQTSTTGQVKDVSPKPADGLNAIPRTPPENPQTSTFGQEKNVSLIPGDVLIAMPQTPPDAIQIPVGLAVIPRTPPEGPRKPMVIPRTPPGRLLKSKASAPMAEQEVKTRMLVAL